MEIKERESRAPLGIPLQKGDKIVKCLISILFHIPSTASSIFFLFSTSVLLAFSHPFIVLLSFLPSFLNFELLQTHGFRKQFKICKRWIYGLMNEEERNTFFNIVDFFNHNCYSFLQFSLVCCPQLPFPSTSAEAFNKSSRSKL